MVTAVAKNNVSGTAWRKKTQACNCATDVERKELRLEDSQDVGQLREDARSATHFRVPNVVTHSDPSDLIRGSSNRETCTCPFSTSQAEKCIIIFDKKNTIYILVKEVEDD